MNTAQRIGLFVIAAASCVVGAWAQLFPRSFYDDFPGMGRTWVALDGPFNEHLVRDVGGLNLALAVVAGSGLLFRHPLLARVAGAAALVYGLPHLLYHATHADTFGTGDAAAMLVSLTLNVIAATLTFAPARPAAVHP
ncbi:MAG TPA: hypothetical protein VMM60_14390 [Ilumatobacter sp.]|nr:hypothetical protein [Ilumatobacter sp.]